MPAASSTARASSETTSEFRPAPRPWSVSIDPAEAHGLEHGEPAAVAPRVGERRPHVEAGPERDARAARCGLVDGAGAGRTSRGARPARPAARSKEKRKPSPWPSTLRLRCRRATGMNAVSRRRSRSRKKASPRSRISSVDWTRSTTRIASTAPAGVASARATASASARSRSSCRPRTHARYRAACACRSQRRRPVSTTPDGGESREEHEQLGQEVDARLEQRRRAARQQVRRQPAGEPAQGEQAQEHQRRRRRATGGR